MKMDFQMLVLTIKLRKMISEILTMIIQKQYYKSIEEKNLGLYPDYRDKLLSGRRCV